MHHSKFRLLYCGAIAGAVALALAGCERQDDTQRDAATKTETPIPPAASIPPPVASPPPATPSTIAPPATQAPPRATTTPRSESRVTQMPTPELQKTPSGGKPNAKPSSGAAANGAGQRVYTASCAACHDRGVSGAPKLGDQADWAPRIAQGQGVLVTHAKNGFAGKKGFMPPKGGNAALTDAELAAAVSYMVEQAK